MASLAANAVKLYSRLMIKTKPSDPVALVQHIRRNFNNPPPSVLPFGVRRERFQAEGLKGDWLRVQKPTQVILYLHGGGYVGGVPRTYHNLCGRLARELRADVYLPKYRLAPEHPFPAALDDALAGYELLLQKGYSSRQITVAGDSAGGGLTLGLLLALRDRGLPLPKCAVALSPYADLTCTLDSRHYNDKKDAMLSYGMLSVGKHLYTRTEADMRHPYASPVFGDYAGLPPLLLTVCEEECFRDDSYVVAERARGAGVPVEMISRQDLFHVWPIFYPLLPEARTDVKRIIAFIRSH